MFGSRKNAAEAYAKIGEETGVLAASPHKLIVMLFDGALTAIANAMKAMEAGNIEEKGRAISKAIMIIDSGLNAALDRRAGGEIAESLGALYAYMSQRLLTANLRNDIGMLLEVQALLTDLRGAWNDIETPARAAKAIAAQSAQAPRNAYESFAPRVGGLVTI